MAYVDQDQPFFSNMVKTGLWSDAYFDLYPVKKNLGACPRTRIETKIPEIL